MKILVDADACPVKKEIVNVAKKYSIDVWMFIDTSHQLDDGYSKILTFDKGKDSVDLALANNISTGDIVVTQDYGLAMISITKRAIVLNQNGFEYTDHNIQKLLFERYLSSEIRRAGGKTNRFKKRDLAQNMDFERLLEKIIQQKLKEE